MKQSSHAKAGFTLVEVLVASSIMMFALGGLLSNFILCKRLVYRTNRHAEAMHLARAQLEEVIANDYDSTELSVGTHQTGEGTYRIVSGPVSGTKDITLTVSWSDPTSPSRVNLSLSTSISRGLH